MSNLANRTDIVINKITDKGSTICLTEVHFKTTLATSHSFCYECTTAVDIFNIDSQTFPTSNSCFDFTKLITGNVDKQREVQDR